MWYFFLNNHTPLVSILVVLSSLLKLLSANSPDASISRISRSLTSEGYPDHIRLSPPNLLPGTKNWKRLQDPSSSSFPPRHSHAVAIFPCPGNEEVKEGGDSWDTIDQNGTSAESTLNKTVVSKKKCIWLTGGRTNLIRTWDLRMEDRAADVWWSEDGSRWNRVDNMTGDFLMGVGNHDAKVGGSVSPWYGRYGHSTDVVVVGDEGNSNDNKVLVLTGGNCPEPSNDVWVSPNGSSWFFAGFASWGPRAYHATAVYDGKLWVLGGTPLRNDIWSGKLLNGLEHRGHPQHGLDGRDIGSSSYRFAWRLEVRDGKAPWSPRAGMCVVTQQRQSNSPLQRSDKNEARSGDSNATTDGSTDNSNNIHKEKRMFLIGGFAGWPRDDSRWEGTRTRNDVWITSNGKVWTELFPISSKDETRKKENAGMPFRGRAWHSCTTWHHPRDKGVYHRDDHTHNIHAHNINDESREKWPRIYLSGGGYMGTKGNNVVRTLEGHVDLWWSVDGSNWTRVDHEEGSARPLRPGRFKNNLYSTNEWTVTEVEGENVHLGKWGHAMVSFVTNEDLNLDGMITVNSAVSIEFCASYSSPLSSIASDTDSAIKEEGIGQCRSVTYKEDTVPSLLIIGGDTTDGGPIVNDVFISRPGVNCDIHGVTCSGRGSCGPVNMGCVCNSNNFKGEYCEIDDKTFTSAAIFFLTKNWTLVFVTQTIVLISIAL